ncbi:SusC/RagA family TonB-linked outer membrane protein [Niabella aurantiaca]|uniref:SusC/RagA family TonB-linked outer membrane protein n=1 Tax=Niabella aurantiaca TaxID=379900 RepID=UPI0003A02D20|nr:TonB-dependent receptor [Niabella aurantiaca]
MIRCLLALVLLMGVSSVRAQQVLLHGVVTGADGAPLSGVSVKISDLPGGTTTDAEGKYTIGLRDRKAVLIFSFVGYFTQELSPGSGPVLNVQLQPGETTGLDEVVVVGYGTVKKKDLTGSVGKVNVADMNKAPVRSFDEALAGRTAGVQVSSNDGQPGSGISIVVRGNNSITQENSPLYVVDGFPIESPDNNAINPSDIESIEVLKDASATAIYGARGANGVIMITSKKGKEGPPVLQLDVSYGFQDPTKRMNMMNPYEFVKYQLELDTNSVSSGTTLTPKEVYLRDGKTLDSYKNMTGTDWQDLVMKRATMANYNLALSGGSRQTKYAVSGSILNQKGVLINSGYNRYQGRVVLDQSVGTRLKVGINTNYTYLVQSGMSPSEGGGSSTNKIFASVWGMRPVSPNVDGDLEDLLFDPSIDPANDYRINPVINLENIVRKNRTKNLVANVYAEYTLLPGLKLRVTGGLNDRLVRSESFNNSNTQFGNSRTINGVNGSLAFAQTNSWVNENILTWNKSMNGHSINMVGGFTAQGGKSSVYGMSAIQLPNESLGISGLEEGTVQPLTARSSLWNLASFLGRVNYSYRSKYLLTASFRSDGSSKFSETNHWSYFPSGAVSWRFSEEGFLKGNAVLSDGKIRIGYGVTGNNRVGDFSYLTTFGLPVGSGYVFNNSFISGIVPLALGNSDLKWETTGQSDLGLDLAFFKQRVMLTVDVYRKKTTDLLLNANLPNSSGFDVAYKNIGSVQNEGLEITLETVNMKKKDFSWSSNFNISFNRNKVLGLAENQESLERPVNWDNGWTSTSAYIARLGGALGQMYGYIWDGVYSYDDFDRTGSGGYVLKDNVPTNGNTREKIQPGDIRYRDINGDLKVDAKDYTVIGRGLPVHYGGFSNNFTYKNFDLNVFFQWSYGNDVYNINKLMFEGRSSLAFNQFASYADRWSPGNTDSKLYRTKGYFGGGYSSYLVEDGSYLRLKTVALGYNFNRAVLDRIRIKGLRVYAAAQNLITWTRYTGMDPEVSAYNSALTPGFDYSTYPRSRTITFGAKITF